MSRETKIGMLTGLFVIVIIGVLLSNYLGNNESAAPGPKMAAVDNAGEPARKALQQPPAAPGLQHESMSNAMVMVPKVGSPEIPQTIARTGDGPIITPPTKPEVVGRAREVAAVSERDSMIELGGPNPRETHEISFLTPEQAKAEALKKAATGTTEVSKAVPAPTSKTETYVIAKGDTLTIIAKRFYKSAGKADLAKIIAANPGTLKDEKSQLVIGKKLSIPDVKIAAAPVSGGTPTGGVVFTGSGTGTTKAPEKAIEKPASIKTYVVQKGDTIERIARKFTATNTPALVKAIMSANNLKAESTLKIGQKIKVPEVTAAPALPVLAGM